MVAFGGSNTHRFFFWTYITCKRESTVVSGNPGRPTLLHTLHSTVPGQQPCSKKVWVCVNVGAPYHSHHHSDQGDEEERPQYIAHHGVAVGLGVSGHCGVTHDIGSWRAG